MEEKAAAFQEMLSHKDGRVVLYLNKITAAVLLGGIATVLLTGISMPAFSFHSFAPEDYRIFVLSSLGMFAGSIPLYVIYMFFSIR